MKTDDCLNCKHVISLVDNMQGGKEIFNYDCYQFNGSFQQGFDIGPNFRCGKWEPTGTPEGE